MLGFFKEEPAKTMHSQSDLDSFRVRNFSHLSTDNCIICLVSLNFATVSGNNIAW